MTDNSKSNMSKYFYIQLRLAYFITIVMLFNHTSYCQQSYEKLAQTGMKFLNVCQFARQASLAEAFTARDADAASMFSNPAGLADLHNSYDIALSQVGWLAGIRHYSGAIGFKSFGEKLGSFGISVQYVNYGIIEQTILFQSPSSNMGYIDCGTFTPYALSVGIGYARSFSNSLSAGGVIKFITQDLGNSIIDADTMGGEIFNSNSQSNTLSAFAFDFGIIYKTPFKSLAFGMTVRNISEDVKFQKESFQLPFIFKMGLSMEMVEILDPESRNFHTLLITVDSEHSSDYPEQFQIGAEYVLMKTLALRLGYVTPADEHSVSYGIGFDQFIDGYSFGIDFAYTPFGIFDNVYRLSVGFGF